MPRKRRWRHTIQSDTASIHSSPSPVAATATQATPTPLPISEIRHVLGIVLLLALLLVGTAVALHTGSNRATLDAYLGNLLGQPS